MTNDLALNRQQRLARESATSPSGLHPSTDAPATDEIVFHVGAHKTASSFVQTLLKSHASEIGRLGYSAVHRAKLIASPLHLALLEIGKGCEPSAELHEKASDALHAMLANCRRHVLFSSEDMLHRIGDVNFFANAGRAMTFQRGLADPIPVRVMLYTRSQPDYVESVYMQFMHLGRTFTFSEFRDRIRGADLSWKRVLDELANAVGAENVVAMPYESIKRLGSENFYRNFLKVWGVPQPEHLAIPEETENSRGANRSFSADALKIARFVGPMLDKDGRNSLRKFLQENFSTATHQKALLYSPQERRRLLDSLADDNIALFETWLKDWPKERCFYL